MGEWQRVELGELINIKHGYAFPGSAISTEPSDEILVTPGNFNYGGGFKLGKLKYFHDAAPNDYVLRTGDLVVTMTDLSKETDTLGYAAKIPNLSNKRFLHNQRIGLVTSISERADLNFLYWVMRTDSYQGFIAGAATGMSVMHTSPTTIRSYEFDLPPLPEQKAIAEVLSSLDDKIHLLHRQNKTLESLAQTLFRQWFIESPSSTWKEGKVIDLFVLQRGFDLPSQIRRAGPHPIYSSSGIAGYHDEYKIKAPGVTTGRSGLIGKVFYARENFWPLNTSLFVVEYKLATPLFTYFFLDTLGLDELNAGSAVPTLNRNDVHSLTCVLPDKEKVLDFEKFASLQFQKIASNKNQLQNLSKLRDMLLPKLMSGEIQMEEIHD